MAQKKLTYADIMKLAESYGVSSNTFLHLLLIGMSGRSK